VQDYHKLKIRKEKHHSHML